MLEAGAVAAAEDVSRHGEFVAVHVPRLREETGKRAGEVHGAKLAVRINVDQLDDPVRVGATCGSDQVNDWLAGQLDRGRERFAHEGEHVGAAIHEALVGHKPCAPTGAVPLQDGPRTIRHWLRGIGYKFRVACGVVYVIGCSERKVATVREIEPLRRHATSLLATSGESGETIP